MLSFLSITLLSVILMSVFSVCTANICFIFVGATLTAGLCCHQHLLDDIKMLIWSFLIAKIALLHCLASHILSLTLEQELASEFNFQAVCWKSYQIGSGQLNCTCLGCCIRQLIHEDC